MQIVEPTDSLSLLRYRSCKDARMKFILQGSTVWDTVVSEASMIGSRARESFGKP